MRVLALVALTIVVAAFVLGRLALESEHPLAGIAVGVIGLLALVGLVFVFIGASVVRAVQAARQIFGRTDEPER